MWRGLKSINRGHPGFQHLTRPIHDFSRLTIKVDKARAVFAAAPSAHILTIQHRPGNSPTPTMVISGTRKGEEEASPGAEIDPSRRPAAKRPRVGRALGPILLPRQSSLALQPTCRRRPGGCSACVCSCSWRFFHSWRLTLPRQWHGSVRLTSDLHQQEHRFSRCQST